MVRMATSNDIKNGTVIIENGQLWSVTEFQHVKPGKGGAFVRTKQKNVVTGKIIDKTYNAGAKIETANVDRRDYQYLYRDGADFVFMDLADYDQLTVAGTVVGDAEKFMLENQQVTIAVYDGSPLYIEMPPSVVLEVTYTEPGLQGDRSTGGSKLSNGRNRGRNSGATVSRNGNKSESRYAYWRVSQPSKRLGNLD